MGQETARARVVRALPPCSLTRARRPLDSYGCCRRAAAELLPSASVTADPATERALLAAGRTRALGMHFLGHFLGISGRPTPVGTARLTLDRPVLDCQPPAVPVLSYCALADLVLGSAIRSHFGAGARLGTVTLAIQHPTAPVQGPLVGEGRALEPRASHSVAQASIATGDRVVGHAQGWFSALPPPGGRKPRPLPWEVEELPPVPTLAPADLDEAEARALAAVQAAERRARASGTAVEDELLHFTWHPSDPHTAHGELTVGPELGNRVGHLQGGALYAAGARAAFQALGGHGWILADGYYQFLRPGDGLQLAVRAEVLRRGRSAAFAQAHLAVDGVPVGVGLYAFQAAHPPTA